MNNIFDKLDAITETFSYGYVDINNKIHDTVDSEFEEKYILRSPTEIIINKIGCCWDHVEALRYLYKKFNLDNIRSYFILNNDGDKYPHGHTIIVLEAGSNYYWYSPSYDDIYGGNRKYKSIKLLLNDLKKRFERTICKDGIKNIIIYEYSKPDDNISCDLFYEHCKKGNLMNN